MKKNEDLEDQPDGTSAEDPRDSIHPEVEKLGGLVPPEANVKELYREYLSRKHLPLDPGDRLDPADRANLHRALDASQADIDAGRLIDAEDALRDLRGQ